MRRNKKKRRVVVTELRRTHVALQLLSYRLDDCCSSLLSVYYQRLQRTAPVSYGSHGRQSSCRRLVPSSDALSCCLLCWYKRYIFPMSYDFKFEKTASRQRPLHVIEITSNSKEISKPSHPKALLLLAF